ncbi:MAG: NmrA family NAD(P)-binding protein, partial [Gammaproteobacteria bacterium]|nr:NmrA family NAD(P)-binding protein [Gammaproteobacteria bacterium]
MTKPKILVTGAAGRTGSVVVQQLLQKGYPVRAFVRTHDRRADALERAGAEMTFGDLFDFHDLRDAMRGVERAYHCAPFVPNVLETNVVFALAAEQAKLEVVALMSGWNDHAAHPSIVSRGHWLSKQIFRWMPSVDVIHINPGIFAYIYLLGLPAVVHFGMLMAPFGNGLNAPPSSEDIARAVVGALTDPAPHIGKSYRPTGPALISPEDVAGILGNILGRRVAYRDSSFDMFAKAGKGLGFPDFEVSQLRYYAEEISRGTYAVGAPTDHVELLTGQKPESFEQTARRYIADPSLIHPRLVVGNKLNAIAFMVRMMFSRAEDFGRWERRRGYPALEN